MYKAGIKIKIWPWSFNLPHLCWDLLELIGMLWSPQHNQWQFWGYFHMSNLHWIQQDDQIMIEFSLPNQSTFNPDFLKCHKFWNGGLNFGCFKLKSGNGMRSLNIWIKCLKCLVDRLNLENTKFRESLFRRFV